jgi:hypothetical protein
MANTRVFLSHTKFDKDFCDKFDNICSNVGMKRFRSEFAEIDKPPWQTIKEQLGKSRALFLLIGKELVNRQASQYNPDWKFTQNWISYEVGIAHQRNIDIWVVCDSVQINFPVPYFNNYVPFGLDPGASMEYMNMVLENYLRGLSFPISLKPDSITQQCRSCDIQFNLHATLEMGTVIICPHCLGGIEFHEPFSSTMYG